MQSVACVGVTRLSLVAQDQLVKRYFLHSLMSVKELDWPYRKITKRCKCAKSSSLMFSGLSDSH